jgi:hypothetical protein
MTGALSLTAVAAGALALAATGRFAAPPRPVMTAAAAANSVAVYPRIEASFTLPGLTGNPFDYRENDVKVTVSRPGGGGELVLPAFFDGGETWRVRHTPTAPGCYKVVRVTVNGKPLKAGALAPAGGWDVAAATARPSLTGGYVRRDPADPARLAFEDGATYYPVGHNVAWRGGSDPDYATTFGKMGAAGENWSRVWMNHWDDKNLDWPTGRKVEPGRLDLEVARKWDGIVDAAEKNGVRFQMTLQHHGQYSTDVNPNWNENPWNKANGGWLATPEEFFTDARAKALTKAKYRYIVARWGYSPAVLAWELFNEVQFTAAARKRDYAAVAAWHKEMAAFLREQDPYRHLVTTSSDTDLPGLYDAADYVQPHSYSPDPAQATQAADPAGYKKPIFFGEIGGAGDLSQDDGSVLHSILWSSFASPASGAAQYWAWDTVEKNGLYPRFAAATAFLKAAGPAVVSTRLRPAAVGAETKTRGAISFGPGGGWGAGKGSVFPISPSGAVGNAGNIMSFLQGRAHPELFARADFPVTLSEPATFTVTFRQAAKSGAHPVVLVDGAVAAEHDFPAGAKDADVDVTLSAKVPAGAHTIRLENTGADWAVIARIGLSPYGPTLRPLGKSGPGGALVWVRSTAAGGTPNAGRLTVPGLTPGARYRALWWDTWAGRPLSDAAVTAGKDGSVALDTPPVTRDAALALTPAK